MFVNHQPPSSATIAYRQRVRAFRPRATAILQRVAHLYVGVTRQSVSARVRAKKLPTLDGNGYSYSRWARVSISELNRWIDRREAHLDAVACGRRRNRKHRTATKHRPKKTR